MFCFGSECENENCCHWNSIALVKCPAVNWHWLPITSNRYHHGAFIGHPITRECLTEKMKLTRTFCVVAKFWPCCSDEDSEGELLWDARCKRVPWACSVLQEHWSSSWLMAADGAIVEVYDLISTVPVLCCGSMSTWAILISLGQCFLSVDKHTNQYIPY